MNNKKIKLAFYWHMHQPYYKNLLTGEYALPWVRLHALKDYYGMVAILKDFPKIKNNFNIVPSLLTQIQDYVDKKAEEAYIILSNKPAQELTEDEKLFILKNFFSANLKHMIKPYERYYELLKKRGSLATPEALQKVLDKFSIQDFLDLQIWFRLVWLDEIAKEDPLIKNLINKGRNFQEKDKEVLTTKEEEIIKEVVPAYKSALQNHQIEITTSPFYHPIMPLLINSDIAQKSNQKYKNLPSTFQYPIDLDSQLINSINLHSQIFGTAPKGLWPPEGAVSMDIIPFLMKYGIEYFATDEEILAYSLGITNLRDPNRNIIDLAILYSPYEIKIGEKTINVLFRDKWLSDLISFFYQSFDAEKAVEDFLKRLKLIYDNWKEDYEPLVLIVMDGENAWEWYPKNGRIFLRKLYEEISNQDWIETTLISDYLNTTQKRIALPNLHPGSWINHDFSIWIGHPEDNFAWTVLKASRELIDSFPSIEESKKKLALESIYIAEGSDWYWWFGDEHSSEHDEVFDQLFRTHISNVYLLLNLKPPEFLSFPIKQKLKEGIVDFLISPTTIITPKIDGEITSYFEWMGAGELKLSYLFSTHRPSQVPIKKLLYGFDKDFLYFRLDLEAQAIFDFVNGILQIHLNFFVPEYINFIFYFEKAHIAVSCFKGNEKLEIDGKVKASINQILEIAISKIFFPKSLDYQLKILFYEHNALFIEVPPYAFLIISQAYDNLLIDWTA